MPWVGQFALKKVKHLHVFSLCKKKKKTLVQSGSQKVSRNSDKLSANVYTAFSNSSDKIFRNVSLIFPCLSLQQVVLQR